MKHLILSILFLLNPFSALADGLTQYSNTDGAAFCTQCSSSTSLQSVPTQQFQDFKQLAQFVNENMVTINNNFMNGRYRTCNKYVSEKGLGPWGKFIVKEMVNNKFKYEHLFRGSLDMETYCPRYKSLKTDEEKALVFVVILNAAAYLESSCIDKGNNGNGPHGLAKGLYQFHLGNEKIASHSCKTGAANSANESHQCMLSTLDDQFGEYNLLFTENEAHHEVFRWNNWPKGKHSLKFVEIQNALRSFELCQNQ